VKPEDSFITAGAVSLPILFFPSSSIDGDETFFDHLQPLVLRD